MKMRLLFEKVPSIVRIWGFLAICYLISYLILGNEILDVNFYREKIFSIVATIAIIIGTILFISTISGFCTELKSRRLIPIKAIFYLIYVELTCILYLSLIIFIPLDICMIGEKLGL